ncbi:MAG: glycoside hydrolase family 2 TIM barrel-domain containing protein, partial [Rikenellaceae bacterium]
QDPQRWDCDNPNLYTVTTKMLSRDTPIDQSETTFGIRTITYDPDGIYINGEKVRFNGVCLHHDNGPLGGALNIRADERKLQIMKEMGANAIRTSHNPPAPEFMDLCDRLGLYVLVESFDMWRVQKTPQDYSQHFDQWAAEDMASIVKIHRNHPSAIMWSIGNEILDQRLEDGWKTAKMLHEVCHKYDPSRPTTVGFHNYPQPYIYNMVQQVDIVGVNYKPYDYKDIRAAYPQLTLYASETSSGVSSRGVYFQPAGLSVANETLQVSSYDYGGARVPRPMDLEMWAQDENSYVMGQFIWTGFDYLGEPTPYGGRDHSTNGYWNGSWPSHASYFGAVDMVGLLKDRFYFYQSQWTTEPMVHLLPHWNWSGMEGQEIPVLVYTNCEEAELFLNGESLGKKVMGQDIVEFEYYNTSTKEMDTMRSKYRLRWEVPYKAGALKVVAYNGGKAISEKEIRSASKPYAIKLSADRGEISADGKDISYVTIRVEDQDGNLCPLADNEISFEIEGVGELLAVGNGNSASLESFQASHIKAFSGMCVAIIKGIDGEAGDVKVSAKSKMLKGASVVIKTTL